MSFPRYPQYKDSGVEWLGEVPAHWVVTPLKYLVQLRSGGTPSKDRVDYWDGAIPWASAKDMKAETLSDTADHLSDLAIEDGSAALLETKTVLVVVRGMILARTFPVALTAVPMAINQDLKCKALHSDPSATLATMDSSPQSCRSREPIGPLQSHPKEAPQRWAHSGRQHSERLRRGRSWPRGAVRLEERLLAR